MTHAWMAAGVLATSFSAVSLGTVAVAIRTSPEARRLRLVLSSAGNAGAAARGGWSSATMLRAWRKVRGAVGLKENQALASRLQMAGMRAKSAPELYLAAQCVAPLAGAALGSFVPVSTLFWVLAGGVAGYMAPDFWLNARTRKRKAAIARSLPDAVDLLVICVEAGLGLDQALLRVGEELAVSHREIHLEFMQVHLEQRAGKPRLEAWESLAERTRMQEFSAFASMLQQTERFGTPITRALTRFSEDLRMQRRQHAEEAAAKTKVKIIFPLVICIFPCIFIVLLAPALIGMSAGLGAMSR